MTTEIRTAECYLGHRVGESTQSANGRSSFGSVSCVCFEMTDDLRGDVSPKVVVPRRILVVIPSLTPEAGAEASIAAVLPSIVSSGVEVHLALLTDNQVLVHQVERAGVVVHDLSASHFVGQARRIRRIVSRVRPDLVHATLIQASHPTQVGLLGLRVPVLVTWASTPADLVAEHIATWKLWLVRLSEIAAAHLPHTRFHAVTNGVARTRGRSLLVRSDRVSVAERGRDERIFHPASDGEIGMIRAELGLADDTPLLLAVGRQESEKGYTDLITAFDGVAVSNERVHLLVAGRSGSATSQIHETLRSATYPERVHLLGHRDDVANLLRSVDAVVCSSHREGAAGALIEAMGCEIPIVCVELAGIEGVLEDGVNALVVPRAQLASALGEVLDDRAGARRRALAAKTMFDDRFTIQRSAEHLLATYRWTVTGLPSSHG